MIKYALICDTGHEFESWFRDADTFDRQAKRELVACPVCQSTKVNKAIMAPRVARTDNVTRTAAIAQPDKLPSAAEAPQTMALLGERERMLRTVIRELRQKIEANTEDVGTGFPREARKMHQGDIPQRSIRGQASLDEASALLEDGIEVMPIPALPEERN